MTTSKTERLLYAIGIIMVLAIGAGATTYFVSDQSITTPKINNITYVQPGNATDIQTKINTCSGNCIVIIPPGTYTITTPIKLKSDLSLIGQGYPVITRASSIVLLTNETSSPIDNVLIEGIEFDGASISDTKGVYVPSGLRHSIISKNRFVNFNDTWAVSLGTWPNLPTLDVLVDQNIFLAVENGVGIAGNETQIIGNQFENLVYFTSDPSEYGEAIDCNDGYIATISENIITGFNEQGIDANCYQATITGNTVRMPSSADSRISYGISTGRTAYSVVSNNNVFDIGSGDIGIMLGGNPDHSETNLIASGNTVKSLSAGIGTGIFIESGATHVYGNNLEGNLVGINATAGSSPSTVYVGKNSYTSVSTNTYANNTERFETLFDVNYPATINGNLALALVDGVKYQFGTKSAAETDTTNLFLNRDNDFTNLYLRANDTGKVFIDTGTGLAVGTHEGGTGLSRISIKADSYGKALNLEEASGSEAFNIGVISDGSLAMWNSNNTNYTLRLADTNYGLLYLLDAAQAIKVTISADTTYSTQFLNLTVNDLAGSGNDYVCVNSAGKLYRNDTACA